MQRGHSLLDLWKNIFTARFISHRILEKLSGCQLGVRSDPTRYTQTHCGAWKRADVLDVTSVGAWLGGDGFEVGDSGGNNPHPVPRAQSVIIIIAAKMAAVGGEGPMALLLAEVLRRPTLVSRVSVAQAQDTEKPHQFLSLITYHRSL